MIIVRHRLEVPTNPTNFKHRNFHPVRKFQFFIHHKLDNLSFRFRVIIYGFCDVMKIWRNESFPLSDILVPHK